MISPSTLHATLAVVVLVGGSAVTPAHAQQREHPRDMQLPVPQFEIPDTSRFRFVLENGLVGFAVPDLSNPILTFSAFIRGGTGEPPQGAAEMIELMLRTRGPCWMAPGRFSETLERLSARFTVSVGIELIEITLDISTEDAREGIRVFSGIVRETCIDQEGLDNYRTAVARREASRSTDGPTYEGSLAETAERFHEQLFRNHEYSRAVTSEDANRLNLDDVEDFYRDYFNPTNVTLAVSGAFNPREMLGVIDQRFADWQARRPPRLDRASNIETDSVVTVHYPADKLQTWIVVGHELPPIRPMDWAAVEVMNYILGGGHFDTRLFRETRDKRGLTNDASGFLSRHLRGPGSYTFQTYSRPEVAQQLLDVVLAEIERIRSERVTEEELSVAKGALLDGVFPLLFENGHVTARTFALEWARWGTMENLADYPRRVARVSVRDVQRAAERYLHPERFLIVTMGPEIN